MADNETRDKRAQYAYLDLLASTLTEHEKTLDRLINRLEKVSKNLTMTEQPAESEVQEEPVKPEVGIAKTGEPETLTYIRMKLARSTSELKEILESLKE